LLLLQQTYRQFVAGRRMQDGRRRIVTVLALRMRVGARPTQRRRRRSDRVAPEAVWRPTGRGSSDDDVIVPRTRAHERVVFVA